MRRLRWVGLLLLLAGCVQTQWRQGGGPTQTMFGADQSMDLELRDRIARFQRLAYLQGITRPQIEQITFPAGTVAGSGRAVPVLRITFAERDFFAPGGAEPRPQGLQVLGVVAENMRRDVPDVRVTVLGHTDSSGAAAANVALSQARATGVIQALAGMGVNAGQLSAVAIGRAQPIAANASAAGRARNRRVEFLISPFEQANLAAVTIRAIDPAFLADGGAPEQSARRQVTVLRPAFSGPADVSEAPSAPRGGRMVLTAAEPLTVGEESGSPVSVAGRQSTRSVETDSGSPVAAGSALYPPRTTP